MRTEALADALELPAQLAMKLFALVRRRPPDRLPLPLAGSGQPLRRKAFGKMPQGRRGLPRACRGIRIQHPHRVGMEQPDIVGQVPIEPVSARAFGIQVELGPQGQIVMQSAEFRQLLRAQHKHAQLLVVISVRQHGELIARLGRQQPEREHLPVHVEHRQAKRLRELCGRCVYPTAGQRPHHRTVLQAAREYLHDERPVESRFLHFPFALVDARSRLPLKIFRKLANEGSGMHSGTGICGTSLDRGRAPAHGNRARILRRCRTVALHAAGQRVVDQFNGSQYRLRNGQLRTGSHTAARHQAG